MRNNAFTIVELMVTITIIVMMAILAIPAFSTYQKRAELVQKAEELNGLITEMNVQNKNPESGIDEYGMKINPSTGNISSIDFYKQIDGASPVNVRTLNYDNSRDLKLSVVYNGMSANFNKITCSVKEETCCASKTISGDCIKTENLERLKLDDSTIETQGIIKINNNPFISVLTISKY